MALIDENCEKFMISSKIHHDTKPTNAFVKTS